MNCPKCENNMEPVSVGGIEVDRCSKCHGLWFDALEDRDLRRGKAGAALETASAAAGAKHDPKAGANHDAKAVANCPRCKTRMVRMVDREQPHVWYESCSVCYGSYFDAGEFRDLRERSLGDLMKRWRRGARSLS